MKNRQADWRQGWILVLAGFLPIMAIIALAPALPTLMAHFKDVGNPALMVPLLLTAPSACIALLAPVAGVVTDRFGRRRLMLASMVVYGVGGLVPFVIDNFWAVVAGRLLIGVAEAGILTVTNTLLADYYDSETRHRWLMIQGLAGSVLGSLLLACSGYLASLGWQWPFLVYAVAFPIFVFSAIYLFEPQARTAGQPGHGRHDEVASGQAFPWLIVGGVCAFTLLLAVMYFVQPIFFSLVLKENGISNPRDIGLISAIPSLGVPLGSILFKVSGKYGTRTQFILALLCYAIGLIGIGLSADYRWAIAFAFVQQTGSGIVVPGLIAWAQSKLSFEHRGRGMGFWASAFFAGQFISPAAVNAVRGMAEGLKPAFVVFGVLALVCAVVALTRRDKPAALATAHAG